MFRHRGFAAIIWHRAAERSIHQSLRSASCIFGEAVLSKRPLVRLWARPPCQGHELTIMIDTLFVFLAQIPASSPAAAACSGLLGMLPFVFLIVIMYYVMIRPQMRRQKEQAKLVSALKTGDRVVTASGIHGLISNVKETTVIVKVADNVKLEMEKSAVTNVVKSPQA